MSQAQEATAIKSSVGVEGRMPVLSVVSDYINIAKPRIMVLLLITTYCPMVLASGGTVSLSLVLWTLLGGALVSGSASAINCIWDQDIDAVMERTKTRPLPAGRISTGGALIFSALIGLAGVWVLAAQVNVYAAGISLFGHFFYVFIYTMWLKRSTPQNIVIGGAAGAVPPMVGWVAVTGQLDWTAVLLFLVVFLWTPPHFWALALNKNQDYQRANVPMLPVVSGERETHNQMLLYAVLLVVASVSLAYSHPLLGWFSLSSMLLLSAVFALKCYQLRLLSPSACLAKEKKAWDVFSFSLIYLALFFVTLVVDSTVI